MSTIILGAPGQSLADLAATLVAADYAARYRASQGLCDTLSDAAPKDMPESRRAMGQHCRNPKFCPSWGICPLTPACGEG
jgi:hypothetical protein